MIFLILAIFFGDTSATSHASAIPKTVDVVVIGAGLSGLATGYELKKAGVSYHILEATPRVGGRVRTVEYNYGGIKTYVDSGMEEYWESNPAVSILKELKLSVKADVALSSIVIDKKLFELGDENKKEFLDKILTPAGNSALEKFKQNTLAPILNEIKSSKKLSKTTYALKDVSFKDWILKQNLPPLVSEWTRVSIECEIGTEWSRISALDGIAEMHIFMGDGEKSYRIDGGNQKFTSALANAVGNNHISLNQKVNILRYNQNKKNVEVSFLDLEKNIQRTIIAKNVVSTIPIFRLFEVQFDPPLSEKKRQALSSQTWGSYFKAHFFLKSEAERFWIKNGSSIMPILSDSNIGVIYDGNAGQKGRSRILSMLVTGSNAEAFNLMPLDNVRTLMTATLEKMFSGISKEIETVEFYRYHPRAIAAWPVGRSRYDELSQEMRSPENGIHFAGDFTESSHSDGAFISAHRVASEIIAANKRDFAAKKSK